jgi:hypothetical protein
MSSSAFKTRIALVVFALLLCAELTYANDAIVAYRSNTGSCGTDPATNCPKIKFWDSSDGYWGSWGSEIELPNSGSTVRYVRVTQAPIATKTIIVTQSVDSYLDAYVCMMDCDDPSSWTVTNDIAKVSGNDRLFDVIFETNTGSALVVYAVDSSNPSRDLGYKVLPLGETSFTGLTEYYIDDSTTGSDIKCNWVRLDRSTADGQEIIVTAQDDTNKDINAWVWDGSSWGDQIEISTDAPTTSENLAVRYAFNESMGMVIGANGTSGGINYRYWDGSSWSSVGTFSVVSSSSVSWTNLKEDPSTDDLQAIIIDGAKTLHTAYWNGSTWSVTSNIDPAVDGLNTRPADFAWQSTGSTGRVVWDTDGSGKTLSQRECSPQCTGNTTTISTYDKVGNFLTIERNPVSNVKILGIRLNEQNNIGSFAFNGTDYHNYGDSVITSKGQTGFEIQSVSFQISDLKPVVECMVINTSGKYKVFKNLYGAPNDASPLSDYACIKIAVSDVDLDCNGYNITDNGTMGVTYGVLLNGSISNITVKNCAGVSQYDYGLYSYNSNDVNLDNNVLYENSLYGLVLDNSDNVNATTTHLYDNGQGAVYVTTGSTPRSIDLSSLIVDKPLDNYKKYTNLTISDTIEANTAYSIDWTSRPTLPPYMASFADKFVNITNHNGTVSIDSIVWNWLDSELTTTLANYDESNFELWKHNDTWNMLNDSPDTSANTLSLSSENPPGIYGILQSDSIPPTVTIYSPTNSTYNTNTVALNFTVTDDVAVDTCWYNLDGMGNVTLPVCQNTTLGPLADGPHNVTVYANDTAGNTGSDTEYFFTDATPPVVTIYSPMNMTYNTSTVALNYTATDNIALDSCWYSLDGGANISLATCQNITLGPLSYGPHNVTVYANDTAGNVGSDTEYFTVDTTPPSVTLNSPADDSYLNTTSVDFNFTATDNIDTSLDCSLYIDGSLEDTTSAANNTPTIFPVSGLSEGSHNWSVSCTDDANNTGTSATWDFTIDVTDPSVTLNSPADDSYLNTTSVDFNFTATDNIDTSLSCSLYIDGSLEDTASAANNTPTVFSVSGLSEGSHNWSVSCTDDANNTGTSATWDFTIDVTAPTVNLVSPGNNSFTNTTTIDFTFNATDNLATVLNCSLYVDGALEQTNSSTLNNTNTAFTVTGFTEGLHNWTVECTDDASNTAMALPWWFFTVDITPPDVTIQSPTNTTYPTDTIDLNYTATDTNLDSCWYSLDGGTTIPLPDCNDTTLTNLSDGSHNVTVYANDSAGNTNSTTVYFTVDTTPPTVSIQSPQNITYATDTIDLNYTVSDNLGVDSCWYYLDGSGPTALPGCDNITLPTLSDGPHNVTVHVNDTADNSDSDTVYFTVDTTPPNVSIQFPTNTTYTTNILDLNYTATDTNLDSCWYYLDGSGPTSLPDCESIPSGLGPLADGPYNLTVYANDTAGNEGSDTVSFTISVPKPPDDDDDDGKRRMYISYSFVCPGDEVVFNVTRPGGQPVVNAEVRVVYDEPPIFGLVDELDTDSNGLASIVLSEEGTYLVRAQKSGYYTVGATFNFELCPECYDDEDCPDNEQCVDGECVPIECECGYIEDHECIEYECCADSECPPGQACIDHVCDYECYSDEDCDTTEYCEIPEGLEGGLCEPVTGMCGYAENHLWNFHECGDEPECPACPEGALCEDHVCVERALDCPDIGFVGSEQVCHATEDNDSCKFCYVRVTHPDGTVVLGNTDEEGDFSVVLSQVGMYNVTLMVDGTVVDDVVIESLPSPLLLEAQRQFLYDFCLPLLLILLLLLLLWFLWKRSRKDIYAKVLTKRPALGAPVQVKTMSRKKDKAVKGVLVTVYHKGKLLTSGKSNKFGKFTFTPQAKGKYKIHVLNREKPELIVEL